MIIDVVLVPEPAGSVSAGCCVPIVTTLSEMTRPGIIGQLSILKQRVREEGIDMGTGSGTNFQNTPIMNLPLPIPGVCGALGIEPAGTSWLECLNRSLSVLDQHNHTGPGFGASIPAQALSIGADVNWNGNNILGLRSTRYGAISLGSLTSADKGCIVVSGADLYYVDTNGNQVRMTSGGAPVGPPGSISGLVSPAAATYTSASKLFQFTSSPGFAANLSCGPVSIGDAQTNGGNAVTIGVVSGLSANYSLTLPTALPGSNALLALSTAGQMSAFGTVAGSDLTLAGKITATGQSTFTGASGTAAINATGGAGGGSTAITATGGGTNGGGVMGTGTGTGTGGVFMGGSSGDGLHAIAGASGKAATFSSGVVDLGSQRINNLADPTSAQDAATKNYVDTGSAPAVILFGAAAGPAGATTYAFPGFGTPDGTERTLRVPYAGKLSNLYVQIRTAVGGQTVTATVRKNASSDTSLIATTAASGTQASDTSDTVIVAAGDQISVKLTAVGGGISSATDLTITMALTKA